MDKNWYSDCYRKLFLDYHLQQTAVGVGKRFNGAQWAQELAGAGVQAVSCFAKCAYGWRYYQKGRIGRIHPNLPAGMDLLEDTIRECHHRGIKVIAYYHTMGSEYYAALHPEWRITRIDGTADFRGICMLSPAVEKEMLPQIGEIAANYDIDGIFFDGTYTDGSVCYCESCRKRYREEMGRELPLSPREEDDGAYRKWALEVYRKLRERIAETVHQHKPSVLISFNWCYSPRQVEDIPREVGFLSEDIGPGNMLSYASLVARYWALTEVPFDVMNHMSLKWWSEWGIKPVNSLKQESAVILANGGKTWVGYQMYPEYGVAPYLLKTLGENFEFVRELEETLSKSSVLPYVGVLHGTQQIPSRIEGCPSVFADESSLLGIHRALTFSGIPYNSCSENVFLKNLGRFKAVILSGNQPVRADVLSAVEKYVRQGGRLLLTGITGYVDDKGQFSSNSVLDQLIGAQVSAGYPYNHGYIQLTGKSPISEKTAEMPMLSSQPFALVKPKAASVLGMTRAIYLRADGRPMFDEFAGRTVFSPPGDELDSASITVNSYGKGCVAYIATDVFASYAGGSQWYLKNLVKNILNGVLLKEQAIILDAPDYVEVSLMERGDELHIHLTNLIREWPAYNFTDTLEYVIGEDVPPIHQITLHLPVKNNPREVCLSNGKPLTYSVREGSLSITLECLELHSCIFVKGYFDT